MQFRLVLDRFEAYRMGPTSHAVRTVSKPLSLSLSLFFFFFLPICIPLLPLPLLNASSRLAQNRDELIGSIQSVKLKPRYFDISLGA